MGLKLVPCSLVLITSLIYPVLPVCVCLHRSALKEPLSVAVGVLSQSRHFALFRFHGLLIFFLFVSYIRLYIVLLFHGSLVLDGAPALKPLF
jgi:hypothetical protein